MKKALILFLFHLSLFSLNAQTSWDLKDLQPEKAYDNIHVQKITNTEDASVFVIWVKQDVKAHKHEFHTENIYVIEGKAEMRLGDTVLLISAGDYLNIPRNTVHAVKVTSEIPLKVISIQSPEFDGSDRVFIQDK